MGCFQCHHGEQNYSADSYTTFFGLLVYIRIIDFHLVLNTLFNYVYVSGWGLCALEYGALLKPEEGITCHPLPAEAIVNYSYWVWGTKLRFSAKAAST